MGRNIVIKMVSGETLMAKYIDEDSRSVLVEYPVQIRSHILPNSRESITANPYCQFTSDIHYEFEKAHIIYVKPLHSVFEQYYNNFLKQYEEVTMPLEPEQEEVDMDEIFETLMDSEVTKH